MLLRHSLTYLLSRSISAAALLLGLWWFSRVLSPADYGFYVTVMGLATVGSATVFQWLRLTLLRQLAGPEDRTALIANALAIFGVLLLLSLLPLPLMWLLPAGWWTPLIPSVLGCTMAMAISEFSRELLRAQLKPWQHCLHSVLTDLLQLVFAGIALQQGLGGLGLVLALQAANLLPVLVWLPRTTAGSWPPRLTPAIASRMLAYGLPLAGMYGVGTVLGNLDRLLLPWLAGVSAAGLYGTASGLARQGLFMLMQSVNLAAFPLALAAYRNGDEQAARRQLHDNIVLLLAIGLPGAAGLAVLAPVIAHTLLGPAFAADAARLLPWLALGTLLTGLRVFYTDQAFQLAQDTRTPLLTTVVATLVALPLSRLLILRYQLDGAVYGALAGFALALLLSYVMGRRRFDMPVPGRETGWITTGTLLMGLALWPWREAQGWLPLLTLMGAGAGIYAAVLVTGNVMGLRRVLARQAGA